MTKKSQLKTHLTTLEDIGKIMTAMRNLALIELNKTKKIIDFQQAATATIKAAGSDFLAFYPEFYTELQSKAPQLLILSGSERGFCGSFNQQLLENYLNQNQHQESQVIIIGNKLAAKFPDSERVATVMESAHAIEEIPALIARLLQAINALSQSRSSKLHPACWSIIYNQMQQNTMQTAALRPLIEFKKDQKETYAFAPLLTIPPADFLSDYMEQYVLSMLYEVFYQSFLSEQQQRFHHLQGALDRLQKKTDGLKHASNKLRREAITEEIQIIMLGAEMVDDNPDIF